MSVDPWTVKRQTPYTVSGIRRKECIRCGEQATVQWQICADGNNYRPVCDTCDKLLNRLVIKFMRHPDAKQIIQEYEA